MAGKVRRWLFGGRVIRLTDTAPETDAQKELRALHAIVRRINEARR